MNAKGCNPKKLQASVTLDRPNGRAGIEEGNRERIVQNRASEARTRPFPFGRTCNDQAQRPRFEIQLEMARHPEKCHSEL